MPANNRYGWFVLWTFVGMLGLCLLPTLSQAQCRLPGSDQGFVPIPNAYEALSVSGTAVGLAKVNQWTTATAMAFVTVEGNAVSISEVVTPSLTDGHQLPVGAQFYLCGQASMAAFKAISLSGTATLKVSYYTVRK